MSNRFVDTERWREDWYCELGGEYQKFWDYICDHCDNAGVWKPNKIDFEIKTRFKINLDSFFKKVNGDKERILLLDNGRWFIPGFITYQWFNKKDMYDLTLTNKLHKSLFDLLLKHHVPLDKVRGLKEVLNGSNEGLKDLKGQGQGNDMKGEGTGEGNASPKIITIPAVMVSGHLMPKIEEVKMYFYQQGAKDGWAEKFFNNYEGKNWQQGNTPIYSWRSFANNWIVDNIERDKNKTNNHTPPVKLDARWKK